jgi:2-methylisocitrate lyase-like PEP mutase family enzyme
MPPRVHPRELRDPGRISQIVSVHNALAARVAAEFEFDWLAVGGYNVSGSLYGMPDVGLLTMTEAIDQVRRIAAVCERPLLVDGDDGYGNHLNVVRLVREVERAGGSGVHLEDQVFPKKCGHMARKRIVDTEAFVNKVKAFVDTRQSEDLLLFARTDAIGVTGFDDAIERGNRYLEAGADVIFIEAPLDMDQVKAIPKLIPGPVLYNWVFKGMSPLVHPDELCELGYRFVLQADVLYPVVFALRQYFRDLKETGTYGKSAERMIGFDEFNDLIGLAEVQALDDRYGGWS